MICCLKEKKSMEVDQVGDYEKPAIVRVFGHEVKDFSSQYGAEERMSYAAQNLAGDFNIYPNYGDFTQACVFRTYGPWWRMAPSAPAPFRKTPSPDNLQSEDFIEVLFTERLYPVAVQVYETYNPGAIVKILACDYQAGTNVDTGRQNKWFTLWSKPVTETPQRVRIFSPPIRRIDVPINLVRLELNHSLLHYYTELDCVMLCGVRHKPAVNDYPTLRAQAQVMAAPKLTLADHVMPPGDSNTDDADTGEREPQTVEDEVVRDLETLKISEGDEHSEDGDPHLFHMLPGEIIVMILSYLDIPSLGKVAQTCRLLQSHAYDRILYTELNLQPVWNLVNDRTLQGLSKRCDSLQRLCLSWCGQRDTVHCPGFVQLLQSCSETLTCLQLSCCSFVNQDSLRLVAALCSNLKELDVSGCVVVDKMSAICLIQLTNLERLNIYRTKIDTHTIMCIIRSLPKLQHLNMGSCKLIANTGEVVEELGQHCPNLRSVDLWRARNIQDKSFQRFVSNCPHLEELDLGWCTELTSRAGSFTNIASSCPNLKKLFLTANRTVCDTDLLSLAKHSRQLQQLDILGTREVSSDAVDKVLSSCPDMIMLDVSFCAGITDQDVASWNTKFPKVNIKKSFQNST